MTTGRVLGLILIVACACEGKGTARDDAKTDASPTAPADTPPTPGSIDPLIQLPAERPTELAAACQQVVDAYEGYMDRVSPEGSDERAEWDKKRAAQLQMTQILCTKNAILDVAACQQYAFDHAGPEHRDELGPIMRRCMEKFGGARPD